MQTLSLSSVAMSKKNLDTLQERCDLIAKCCLSGAERWFSHQNRFSGTRVTTLTVSRITKNFLPNISIIRAIGRRGPGSDKTTRISVTNEQVFTGQRPLCSLSCTLYS